MVQQQFFVASISWVLLNVWGLPILEQLQLSLRKKNCWPPKFYIHLKLRVPTTIRIFCFYPGVCRQPNLNVGVSVLSNVTHLPFYWVYIVLLCLFQSCWGVLQSMLWWTWSSSYSPACLSSPKISGVLTSKRWSFSFLSLLLINSRLRIEIGIFIWMNVSERKWEITKKTLQSLCMKWTVEKKKQNRLTLLAYNSCCSTQYVLLRSR